MWDVGIPEVATGHFLRSFPERRFLAGLVVSTNLRFVLEAEVVPNPPGPRRGRRLLVWRHHQRPAQLPAKLLGIAVDPATSCSLLGGLVENPLISTKKVKV